MGRCQLGEMCKFAHGEIELGIPQPQQNSFASVGSNTTAPRFTAWGDAGILGVELFLAGHDVDAGTQELFRSMPTSTQNIVMAAGDLAQERNPTATLMSRMQQAAASDASANANVSRSRSPHRRAGGKGGGKKGVPDSSFEEICIKVKRDAAGSAGYGVDMVGPPVVRHVDANRYDLQPMAVGDFITAVNGISVTDFEGYKRLAVGQREFLLNILPAHAKQNASPSQAAPWSAPQTTGGWVVPGATPAPAVAIRLMPEVELFLDSYTLQPHAVDKFKVLPYELQKVIMAKGDMHGARDATAVLISRIQRAIASATPMQLREMQQIQSSQPLPSADPTKEYCKYFQKGHCGKGRDCKFQHAIKAHQPIGGTGTFGDQKPNPATLNAVLAAASSVQTSMIAGQDDPNRGELAESAINFAQNELGSLAAHALQQAALANQPHTIG